MQITEAVLARLARRLLKTEIAHSNEMKASLAGRDAYTAHRQAEAARILRAATEQGVTVRAKRVLDLGCGDGYSTHGYAAAGATTVIGVDIDATAIARAAARNADPRVSFAVSEVLSLPLPDRSVDTIIAFDVFEHVADVRGLLEECRRVLDPDGRILIGTWGWGHPFAPHLWSIMPVPWAHLLVSERTLYAACRRVYKSGWYRPTMHDFDENGQRIAERFVQDKVDTSYLNKFYIRDFERAFHSAKFDARLHLVGFSHPLARWTHGLLKVRGVREVLTGYFWAILKPAA